MHATAPKSWSNKLQIIEVVSLQSHLIYKGLLTVLNLFSVGSASNLNLLIKTRLNTQMVWKAETGENAIIYDLEGN